MFNSKYNQLLSEFEAQKKELQTYKNLVEEYQKKEESIAGAIINAQSTGKKIICEAQSKADCIIYDAEKIIEDARAASKKIIEDSRDLAQKNLAEAEAAAQEYDANVKMLNQGLINASHEAKNQAKTFAEILEKISLMLEDHNEDSRILSDYAAENLEVNAEPEEQTTPVELMRNIYTIQGRTIPVDAQANYMSDERVPEGEEEQTAEEKPVADAPQKPYIHIDYTEHDHPLEPTEVEIFDEKEQHKAMEPHDVEVWTVEQVSGVAEEYKQDKKNSELELELDKLINDVING